MTIYRFTLTNQSGMKRVVEWRIGDVDPGKEVLKASTGSNNPDWTVSDYNADTDSNLDIEIHEGAGAVGAAVPIVGGVIDAAANAVSDIGKGIGKALGL